MVCNLVIAWWLYQKWGVLEFSWLIQRVTDGSWRKALGFVMLVKPLVLIPLLRVIPRLQGWMNLLEW